MILKQLMLLLLSIGFAGSVLVNLLAYFDASNELVHAVYMTNVVLSGLGFTYVNLSTMNWFH